MELNEYQKQAMTTCAPTAENFVYMMLNLMAESGELAGKAARRYVRVRRRSTGTTTCGTRRRAGSTRRWKMRCGQKRATYCGSWLGSAM